MKEWNIKYRPHQILNLEKKPGEVVKVEIAGVSQHVGLDDVLYDVIEVDSRTGYPVSQKNLKSLKTK